MPAMIRRLSTLSLGLLILSATACEGAEGQGSAASAAASATAAATSTSDDGTSGGESGESGESTGDGGEGTTGAADDPPFDLNRETIRLLPFAVRLNRLSLLLDRPPEDPIFAELLKRRYDLGDFDHAKGINPDLSWGSARMAAWVAGVRPVCNSAVMKARYPEFPLDLAELMHDAYGYAPTADELAPFEALFDGADDPDAPPPAGDDKGTGPIDPLSASARYETACIAVLTALEFVSQ